MHTNFSQVQNNFKSSLQIYGQNALTTADVSYLLPYLFSHQIENSNSLLNKNKFRQVSTFNLIVLLKFNLIVLGLSKT